jgi:hypothetical protein
MEYVELLHFYLIENLDYRCKMPISFGFVLVSCAIGTLIGGPLGDKFGENM